MYSIKKFITNESYRQKVRKKVENAVSSTAGVQGYNIPGAFTKDEKQRKKKDNRHADVVRATLSTKTDNNTHIREISYQNFKRTDPENPKSPKQKIDDSIRQINRSLREVNKQINILSRYKTETGLGTETYLSSTKQALKKCNERSVKIMTKLKDLI